MSQESVVSQANKYSYYYVSPPNGGGLERSSHGPSSCCWNEGIQVLVNTMAVTAGNSDPSPSCI